LLYALFIYLLIIKIVHWVQHKKRKKLKYRKKEGESVFVLMLYNALKSCLQLTATVCHGSDWAAVLNQLPYNCHWSTN